MVGKLFGIQYLRAIAALAVVCFHAALKENAQFLLGESGVDVFFVISGFLMVAITTDNTSPWRFAKDRIKRIVPVYWFATTVMLVGIIAGLFPNAKLEWWHSIASYLFLPAPSPVGGSLWPLLVPGWTLNYEMAFYAIFALTMFRSRELHRLILLTSILCAAVAGGAYFGTTSPAARFYTNSILLEFAAGAWLGFIWKYRRNWLKYSPALFAIALLGFAGAWVLNTDANRVILFGVPAFLLVAGVLAAERSKPIGRYGPALSLGNASYSIYLWHTLAISVTSKTAEILNLPTAITIFLNIAGGIVIGLVAYLAVEEPLRRLLKRTRVSDASFVKAV